MAQLPEQIDTEGVEPMGEYTPIPVGDYSMVFTSSEVKTAKSGTGWHLDFRAEVIEGPFTGRCVFPLLNLKNENPQAEAMAKRELAAIKIATNVEMKSGDSSEFHNIPFIASVGVDPAKDGYPAKNKILAYKPYSGTTHPPINPATGLPYKPWENWPGKNQ